MRGLLIAASGLVLAACATSTPPSDPEAFDRQATLDLVQALSRDALFGRLPGTQGSAEAQRLITARFEAVGAAPVGDSFSHPITYIPDEDGAGLQPGVNLIAKVEGRRDDPHTLVITAHYDHLGVIEGEIYNGADDNASGVGGLIAMAEYFVANPPRHDVLFVAFDAEEQGFGGARAFIENPPIPEAAITMNLNMDMIARHEGEELWASGAFHTPMLEPMLEELIPDTPIPLALGYDGSDPDQDDWTRLTDSAVFFERGIPHLYLGVEDHPDYHGPGDDFAKIKPDFYLGAVETALMIAIALDANLTDIAAASEP
ncbi:MAG: M28 family peptidase [Pseudomonadota bacterium]